METIALVHLRAFGERVIFGVLDDREIEGAGVLERAAHDRARGDAAAVVGDRDRAGVVQVAHLGELLPLLPHGDGADGVEPGAADLAGARDHHLGDGARVVDRAGVGHHADVGEAARGRGREPREDVFLVFLARLAQVRVQVDERGQEPAVLACDDPSLRRLLEPLGCAPAHAGDDAALDDYVDFGVEPTCSDRWRGWQRR